MSGRTCSTNFGAGAFIDGQAVAAAEQRKLTVYGRSLWAAERPPPRFIPLAGSTLGRIRRVPRLGYPGKPAASPQGTAWPRWLDCEAAAAPHPPQHTSTAITSMLP